MQCYYCEVNTNGLLSAPNIKANPPKYNPKFKDINYRERGSHAGCVYPTQNTSRMETARETRGRRYQNNSKRVRNLKGNKSEIRHS